MLTSSRTTNILLVIILAVGVAIVAMLASGVRGGPLDPPDPPGSTMKTLDDIPGSWSRALRADDGLPGPDPKAGCDSSRFECLEEFYNAVVLDRETGLVWYIEAGGAPTSWLNAQHQCLNFPIGTTVNNEGRRGFHLPTYEELTSLANANPPYLAFGHPFGVVTDDVYWTATSVSTSNARVWSFAAGAGSPNGAPKTDENYFWCVRGGQGYDGL
jgi:hypothetical protein